MSTITNLYDAVKENTCLLPSATTVKVDTNCTAVDMKGFRSCLMIVCMGNSGDTLAAGLKWGLELEDSDDNSTFADVTDATHVDGNVEDLTGGLFYAVDAPAEDSRYILISYKGPKRYVRVVLNATGTHTNGTPISVVGLATGSNHVPI